MSPSTASIGSSSSSLDGFDSIERESSLLVLDPSTDTALLRRSLGVDCKSTDTRVLQMVDHVRMPFSSLLLLSEAGKGKRKRDAAQDLCFQIVYIKEGIMEKGTKEREDAKIIRGEKPFV